ncbi:hypothetical protein B0H14DRAFT_2559383 [Mycena olivaceomarginata]|nr:hypothetical protein B0H14DRAFT_2559383 [Mycena olivaceomarginata]
MPGAQITDNSSTLISGPDSPSLDLHPGGIDKVLGAFPIESHCQIQQHDVQPTGEGICFWCFILQLDLWLWDRNWHRESLPRWDREIGVLGFLTFGRIGGGDGTYRGSSEDQLSPSHVPSSTDADDGQQSETLNTFIKSLSKTTVLFSRWDDEDASKMSSPDEAWQSAHPKKYMAANIGSIGVDKFGIERQYLRKASKDQRPVGEEKVNKAELESHLLVSRGMSSATRGSSGEKFRGDVLGENSSPVHIAREFLGVSKHFLPQRPVAHTGVGACSCSEGRAGGGSGRNGERARVPWWEEQRNC